MKDENKFPETLHEAIKFFSTGDNAHDLIVAKRWPTGVSCPHCASENVTLIASRKIWQCKGCRKQFSVKVGTIFEDSPIKLDKWLCAFWLIVNAKNGISSCELGRSLGVTQKSAWFILHRIRLAIQNGSIEKLSGRVEADETYIGGKARNIHKGKRKTQGTGGAGKTPVQGLLQRTAGGKFSRVKLKVLQTTRKHELQGNVHEYVLKGSEVHTDALKSYQGLNSDFVHQVVDHAICYAKGHVHTNGLENFRCLLKRAVKGTYVNVEPFHLFRYLDEQAFRFNEREDTDAGRFLKAVAGVVGKSLTFAKLTGKEGVEGLPA